MGGVMTLCCGSKDGRKLLNDAEDTTVRGRKRTNTMSLREQDADTAGSADYSLARPRLVTADDTSVRKATMSAEEMVGQEAAQRAEVYTCTV